MRRRDVLGEAAVAGAGALAAFAGMSGSAPRPPTRTSPRSALAIRRDVPVQPATAAGWPCEAALAAAEAGAM